MIARYARPFAHLWDSLYRYPLYRYPLYRYPLYSYPLYRYPLYCYPLYRYPLYRYLRAAYRYTCAEMDMTSCMKQSTNQDCHREQPSSGTQGQKRSLILWLLQLEESAFDWRLWVFNSIERYCCTPRCSGQVSPHDGRRTTAFTAMPYLQYGTGITRHAQLASKRR